MIGCAASAFAPSPIRCRSLAHLTKSRASPGAVEHVLLRGQSGVGKTNLAQNLCFAALQEGSTVRFATLAELPCQEQTPALQCRLRRYASVGLLVLDELGYLPCDSRSADLQYDIISRRHERRSAVLITNSACQKWGTVFPCAACVEALSDRFAQHCSNGDFDAYWTFHERQGSLRNHRSEYVGQTVPLTIRPTSRPVWEIGRLRVVADQ